MKASIGANECSPLSCLPLKADICKCSSSLFLQYNLYSQITQESKKSGVASFNLRQDLILWFDLKIIFKFPDCN